MVLADINIQTVKELCLNEQFTLLQILKHAGKIRKSAISVILFW